VATIKRALTSMHQGLDETNERILANVHKDPEAEKACRALRWLAFSERPVLLAEIGEAIIIEPGDQRLNEMETLFEDDLLGICSSLDYFSAGTQELRLAHKTVKDYLISDMLKPEFQMFGFQERESHAYLTATCLTYFWCLGYGGSFDMVIEFSGTTVGLRPRQSVFKQTYNFAGRKGKGWLKSRILSLHMPGIARIKHAIRADQTDKLLQNIISFLRTGLGNLIDIPECSGISRHRLTWHQRLKESPWIANRFALVFATRVGLTRVVYTLLDSGTDVNTGDILHAQDDEKEKNENKGVKDFFREEQEGVTLSAPLRIALATQDLVMISLLRSRGAYSADLALEHLISGHEWTTPSKPLSGLDVLMPPVVPSNDSMDPLPLELVQVFLIYRSCFHPSTLGKMLGRAILLDDAALVSLLLKAGANLDFDGTSSFAAAFSNSSAPVVNVLLEYGADPKVPELAKHLARGVSSS